MKNAPDSLSHSTALHLFQQGPSTLKIEIKLKNFGTTISKKATETMQNELNLQHKPHESSQTNRDISYAVGLIGLYCYSLFIFLGHAGAALGMILIITSIILQWKKAVEDLRNDPLAWASLFFLFFIWISSAFHAYIFPHTSSLQWNSAIEWSRIIFFIAIAWIIAGRTRQIYISLALTFVGFFLKMFIELDLQNIELALKGGRTGFSYPINQLGVIAATLLTIMIASTAQYLAHYKNQKNNIFYISLWAATFVLIFQLLVITQSRGAWIAVGISASVIMFFSLSKTYMNRNYLFISAATIAVAVLLNTSLIKDRLIEEKEMLINITTSTTDSIPVEGSAGYRFHMISYALKRWSERPLIGWGPGTMITQHFMADEFTSEIDQLQANKLSTHTHLHNSYVTVLAQLGVIGAAYFIVLLYFSVRTPLKAYRSNKVSLNFLSLLYAILISQLILHATNARIDGLVYQLMLGLYVAYCYSFKFKHARPVSPSSPT